MSILISPFSETITDITSTSAGVFNPAGSPNDDRVTTEMSIIINSVGGWSGTKTLEIRYGTTLMHRLRFTNIGTTLWENIFIVQKFAGESITFTTDLAVAEGNITVSRHGVSGEFDPKFVPVVILNEAGITSSAFSTLTALPSEDVFVKSIFAVNMTGGGGTFAIGKKTDTISTASYAVVGMNPSGNVIATDQKINWTYDGFGNNVLRVFTQGTTINAVAFGIHKKP